MTIIAFISVRGMLIRLPSIATFTTMDIKKATPELFVFIPLDWMIAANQSGSVASAVAVPLWFVSKTRGESLITFSNKLATRFGIGRKREGVELQPLHEAGLIGIYRHCGRTPRVPLRSASFRFVPLRSYGAQRPRWELRRAIFLKN